MELEEMQNLQVNDYNRKMPEDTKMKGEEEKANDLKTGNEEEV